MTERNYGWKPDVADHRDFLFRTAPEAAAKLPTFVDRIGLGNPIEDQGNLGSCTGNASTSAMEIVTKIPALSRLFAYYNGRALEGTVKEDAGAMIRDVVKGIGKYGVSTEPLWPYDISKFAKKPPTKAYSNGVANRSKISSYNRVLDLNGLKTALAQGLPVIFGFSVPQYFEEQRVAETGWVPFPQPTDPIIGGHAVLAVGYDERPSATPEAFVWVRNSWGPNWGIQGYFKMPYQWFQSSLRLTDDMWTIVPAGVKLT